MRTWIGSKRVGRAAVSLIGGSVPLCIYQGLIRKEMLGLVYHSVTLQPAPHVEHLFPTKTPAMFESDLGYLTKSFDLPAYDELWDRLQSGRLSRKGRPAAFLSFDDGLTECASVVQPILMKHQVPCIFFLITDCIDNRHLMYRHKVSLCIGKLMELSEPEPKLGDLSLLFKTKRLSRPELIRKMLALKEKDRQQVDLLCDALGIDCRAYLEKKKPYLTQSQIKMLVRNGFKIGAHTRTHPFLADLTPSKIENEIVASCDAVKDITGDREVPFAFPFSGRGIDRSFLQSLRKKHAIIGPMFDTGGIAAHEPFVLHRLTVDPPTAHGTQDSNIPLLLHREYRAVFLAGLRAGMSRFFFM